MQKQLLRGSANAVASRGCRPSLAPTPRRVVRARADPPNLEGNVTREYREDTGEVSVPTSKNADGSLYVDVNAPVRVSPRAPPSFLLLVCCAPTSPTLSRAPPIALRAPAADLMSHPSGAVSIPRPDRTTRARLLDSGCDCCRPSARSCPANVWRPR